jgi:hypothetical protein
MGRGDMPEVFVFVELSERFGWTFQQILDQPDWYIKAIAEKLRVDAKRRKLAK